ncbi:MAG: response regulator transcription factor [Candidatus Obscuribacterales bacterium]|jgi:DNA-binding response OmpR family regulator|nr:response regulator transcription factor [Candidatus Obscuribacterales bacterium]
MAKILIVEDEPAMSEPIKLFLTHEHHLVEVVADGLEAIERLKFYKYDVIILDWMLPNATGVEVCKQFRSGGGTTPILMLTARQQTQEKVFALDAGADDYLTKPYEVQEVSARVRALLRRPQSVAGNVLKARNVILEPSTFKVSRDEQEIQLLPKEFALLEFFMRHPNQVFSAEALLDRVWSSDSEASPETIRTYIKRLRQKIDVAGQTSLINTVHGVGYKLDA